MPLFMGGAFLSEGMLASVREHTEGQQAPTTTLEKSPTHTTTLGKRGKPGAAKAISPPKRPRESRSSSTRTDQRMKIKNDELGTYIRVHGRLFESLEWASFVNAVRQNGDIKVDDTKLRGHPAGPLLKRIAKNGVPSVLTTPPGLDPRSRNELFAEVTNPATNTWISCAKRSSTSFEKGSGL